MLRLKALREADLAFLVLHGLDGEGGLVQAVLELGGLAYTGSGVLASALAMEKAAAKRVLRGAGIPTPRFETLEFQTPEDRRAEIEALGFPVIVKPSRVGSSVGLREAADFAGVREAVAEAKRHDRCVLVEAMLPGREFTVGVVGAGDGGALEALGVGEIVTRSGLFDYHAKYTPRGGRGDLPGADPRRARPAAPGARGRDPPGARPAGFLAGGLPARRRRRALGARSEYAAGHDHPQPAAPVGGGRRNGISGTLRPHRQAGGAKENLR